MIIGDLLGVIGINLTHNKRMQSDAAKPGR